MLCTLSERKSRSEASERIFCPVRLAPAQGHLEGKLGLYHAHLVWLKSAQLQARSRKGMAFTG